MSDVSHFLQSYNSILSQQIQAIGMPQELLDTFTVESCIAQKEGKQLYLVARKADGVRGLLRVTENTACENAIAEANTLYYLNHPAIPKVLGVWQQPQNSFLVREYFEGRPLSTVVQEDGPLAPEDIIGIARSIAEILRYLHAQTPPVIHRDLKPQNLILAADGSIKLIDFGIARSVRPGSDTDTVYLGTRPYAPPEQYGYAQTGPSADIYALGMVMIYLATGGTDRRDLKTRIPSAKLRHLIEKCIAFNPASRFTDANEILRYIQRLKKRRLRLVGLVAGCAVVAILFTVFGYLWGRAQSTQGASSQAYEDGYQAGHAAGYAQGAGVSQPESIPSSASDIPVQVTFEGNLPGNITNGGYAVQGQDAIFYATETGIWRMRPDGSSPEQLSRLSEAKSLNIQDETLYCISGGGIYKIDIQSGEETRLANIWADALYLHGGVLYFENSEDSLCLYRMDTAGNNIQKMNDLRGAYYIQLVGNQMYFSYSAQNRSLYRCNLDGSDLTQIYAGAAHWLSVLNDKIYFVDNESGNGIQSLYLSGGEVQSLSTRTASFLNASPHGIFFATSSGGDHMEYLSLDGGTSSTIVQGDCDNINVAGDWIFYHSGENGNALWMVRTDGTGAQRAHS